MSTRRNMTAMWVFAVSASITLYVVCLLLGDLNQDEGWYLYAARLVSRGKLPFFHFASTQGPLMPAVYVLAQPLVDLWGVAGGRLFTALLGVVTAISGAGLVRKVMRRPDRIPLVNAAALLAFVLIALNIYQVYFTTVVKTYALTGLLIVLGFHLLFTEGDGAGLLTRRFGAGILFAFATATRSSAFILIPVVMLLQGTCLLRDSSRRGPWLFFVLGAAVGGGALFLPFLIGAPEAFFFGLVEYHAARETGGALALLSYKAGFLLRLIGFFFIPLTLAAATAVWSLAGTESSEQGGRPRRSWLRFCGDPLFVLWAGIAAVTLLHLSAPFPYDDYQVIIVPLFAVATAAGLFRVPALGRAPRQRLCAFLALVMVLSIAHSLASPLLQNWLLDERDRIWWPMKSETPLRKLRRVGGVLRDMSEAGDLLLTQDTYLAVESGLDVPAGMELGPFCYFPDMDRERADTCHVMNREKLIETIESGRASVAAFSGYGFAVRSPEITQLPVDEEEELWRILDSRYRNAVTVPRFGQAGTTLTIFERNVQ